MPNDVAAPKRFRVFHLEIALAGLWLSGVFISQRLSAAWIALAILLYALPWLGIAGNQIGRAHV